MKERQFSKTGFAKLSEELAARYMLTRGYRQVSRRFGRVARVDVSDGELLDRLGRDMGRPVRGTAEDWYEYYRRCMSGDVITDVPEPVMFMIRNPGEKYIHRPGDDELVAVIIELGLAQ